MHAVVRRVAAVAVVGGTVWVFGCAPARSTPCSNASDCTAEEGEYAYCLHSQCVECVGRGSCDGHPCNDGVCQIPCDDARDCRGDDVCVDGMCAER